jgi:hypothetical protein
MKSGGSRVGLPFFLFLCVALAAACSSSRESKPKPYYSFISTPQNDTSADDDALIIKGMRDRGGDLSKPVKIDYYFYAYKKSDALKAAADFRRAGYRCVVLPPAESPRDPSMADYWLKRTASRTLPGTAMKRTTRPTRSLR